MITIRTIIPYKLKAKKKKYHIRGDEEKKFEDGVCTQRSCYNQRNPKYRFCDSCLKKASNYRKDRLARQPPKPKAVRPLVDKTTVEWRSKFDRGYKSENNICRVLGCMSIPREGFRCCLPCTEKDRVRHKIGKAKPREGTGTPEYMAKYDRTYKVANKICTVRACTNPAREGKRECETCASKTQGWNKVSYQRKNEKETNGRDLRLHGGADTQGGNSWSAGGGESASGVELQDHRDRETEDFSVFGGGPL